MVKVILTLLIVLAGFSANAQNLKEADVPASVKAKFHSIYPNVKDVRWEMENGKYQAEFDENNFETSVLFDANGNYIQTENEIAISLLPQGVNDYAAKNLSGKKIDEAEKITDAKGIISYEAEIGNDDYLFDANGNFLRKDSDDSDSDGEDDDK